MPGIIDYPIVLERMLKLKFISLYPNSGAFGFEGGVATQSVGWIGPMDQSIRPAARAITRQVGEPYAGNLANVAQRAWRELLAGEVWVTPKSHWAYELEFGSRAWMAKSLKEVGIDASFLAARNNAAAIEFVSGEEEMLRVFVERLLQNLIGSDFAMVFPGRATICTIHSHKQLWWTTENPAVFAGLEKIAVEHFSGA